MTHAQWHAAIRRILVLTERQPQRALQQLDRLLERLHAGAPQRVGEWHVEQTLELISSLQSHLEKHRESAATLFRIAEHHEQQLAYYGRAFVAACATAALESAAAGNRSAGLRALKRAKRVASGLRPPEQLFRRAEQAVAALPRRRRAKV